MPSKQAILDNVDEYSADELVRFIKDGIVTFCELCDETDGCFAAPDRRKVEDILKQSEEAEWQKLLACPNGEIDNAANRFKAAYHASPHLAEIDDVIRRKKAELADSASVTAWENTDKNNVEALREYIRTYPNSPNSPEASRLINEIIKGSMFGQGIDLLINKLKDIQSNDAFITNKSTEKLITITELLTDNRMQKSDLLELLRRDNNALEPKLVLELMNKGWLNYDDFDKIGIARDFVRRLTQGTDKIKFQIPEKLRQVCQKSTEVYFWGIPSSGKSCAIGAVMSVAANGRVARTMKMNPNCQGYGYMNRLSNIFQTDGEVVPLPESTVKHATYEMSFDIIDNDNKSHPLTFIDLAGELVRCMYKFDAHETLSDEEAETLDTLTDVLVDNRTKNRKIHFFVLEYGGDERKYEGLNQRTYLDGALRYIERTGIFKNDTDAIYLLITKADKANTQEQSLRDVLRDYIGNKYRSFYQGLELICQKHEINKGKVEIIPFSLGKVCFQDYCRFDGGPAENVVRKLIERTKGFGRSKLSLFFN